MHFNLNRLHPTISTVKLESIDEKVPIVSFDFRSQLTLLLTDTSVMQSDNLVLNEAVTNADGSTDFSPWFRPYVSSCGILDEVMLGSWYRDTVDEKVKRRNDYVCPLILYVDKTFIDPMRSCFNLEPVSFTLGIFKRKCRSHFSFWRTLGYIPEHPMADSQNTTNGYKAQNYHVMLEAVLSSLFEIHQNPTMLDNFHL
jgi:hypothetical protein